MLQINIAIKIKSFKNTLFFDLIFCVEYFDLKFDS